MQLTSPAFKNGGVIPKKYGRDFENINPPLIIHDIPDNAVSLILTMDDPDVPLAAGVPVWDHWVVFNIPPGTKTIPEAWKPKGIRGKGSRGELNYGGPRPPDKEHRYFFRLYALNAILELPEGSTKKEIVDAMTGYIIAEAELMGRFAPTQMSNNKT